MILSDRMMARILSLAGLAAAVAACFRVRPPGPMGLLPWRFDYAILGALAAACGFLALAYSGSLDRGERWMCRIVAGMAIGIGLFHASLVLPMKVFFHF